MKSNQYIITKTKTNYSFKITNINIHPQCKIRYELFLQNMPKKDKFYAAHQSIKNQTTSTLISKGEWSENSARSIFKCLLNDLKSPYEKSFLDFDISCLLNTFFEFYIAKRIQIAMVCNYYWSMFHIKEKFYYPILISVIVDIFNDVVYQLQHLNILLQLKNRITYDEVLDLLRKLFPLPYINFYDYDIFNYQILTEFIKTVNHDTFKKEVVKKYFDNCVHRMSLVRITENCNNELIGLKMLS